MPFIPLYEQYRPREWSEVIGQDKVIREIGFLRKRSLTGRAYSIIGKSGQGKTTIARLLATEICGTPDCFDLGDAVEIDAKGLEPRDIQEVDRRLHYRGSGPARCRVVIINEVDDLTPSCAKALLVIMERPDCPIPGHAAWIFTSMKEEAGKMLFPDARTTAAFLSRTAELYLTSQGLAKLFAKRAREIAVAEGLDGKPESAYLTLVNECDGNLRRVLQRIEKGTMA